MTTHSTAIPGFSHRAQEQRPALVIPTPVLAVLILIACEIMFFTALISALIVIKASSPVWAPPANVLLPVANTAFNTGVLILSGLLFTWSFRQFSSTKTWANASRCALIAFCLGAFFVIFQGMEWARLLEVGMTMRSGVFGATFFLIIGSHALHVFGGLLAMLWTIYQARRNQLTAGGYQAMMIFWLFVVAIWPVLYRMVYFV